MSKTNVISKEFTKEETKRYKKYTIEDNAIKAYYERCIERIDKEFAPQSQNNIFPMLTKKRTIEILKEELTK